MVRLTAVLLAACLAAPAFGKVEISDVKPMHGPLGPERRSFTVAPGEELFVTYTVTGVGTDAKGNINIERTLYLLTPAGETAAEETAPTQGVIPLAGAAVAAFDRITFGLDIKPGDHKLKITINDKVRRESASFTRVVKVSPPGLNPVRLRFAYDEKGEVPAPAGGLAGQKLYMRVLLVGFDKSQDKIQVTMTAQLLDDQGRETMPVPFQAALNITGADKVAGVVDVTFNANFALNRPGRFTLRLTFVDQISKKSNNLELPVKVEAR
ncbi:MAG: hypothetical protein ACJ8F7_20135 [Gemmataceae bacterium]